MNSISFLLTILSGSIYTIASLPLISNPSYLQSSRFLKILPLIFAFLILLFVKFVYTNEMLSNFYNFSAWCLFLAEILPGFGKRSILLFALLSPATAIGQAIDPFFNNETDKPKTKKE